MSENNNTTRNFQEMVPCQPEMAGEWQVVKVDEERGFAIHLKNLNTASILLRNIASLDSDPLFAKEKGRDTIIHKNWNYFIRVKESGNVQHQKIVGISENSGFVVFIHEILSQKEKDVLPLLDLF